jgi:hypothetical protein
MIPFAMIPFAYASPTKFYFDPASITGPPPGIGETFVVTIRVDSVPDLFMWVMDISWDPAIFDLVGLPVEGQAIKTSGSTVFSYASIADGFIDDLTCGSMFGAQVSVPPNPTDLASLTFQVQAATTGTYITIPWAIWLNFDGVETTPDLESFYYELPPPPPTAPQAKFTPPHCTMVYVGSWVTLDASASTAGYDTLPPPGESCPIVEYKWDIDFHAGPIVTLYGEDIPDAFQCEGPGDVDITLTVTAPDPTAPAHPDYVATNSATHTIHQVTVPTGVVIDVWTEKGGIGLGINWDVDPPEQWPYPTAWSDAFAPQEEVTVYAKVTYNGDIVQNKPVGFEVKDETGEAVLYRTAFTNSTGIATINFRMIWECDKVFAGKFEVWQVWATVSVSEIEKKDVVNFRYGWLVQIDEITAPGTAYKDTTIAVIVDLNNICFTDKTVFVTVVIYDDCGVPIGLDTLADWTVFADDGLTPEFAIYIPKWAYVGTGTIYVNVYTKAPQDCGLPVCPEGSKAIILAKSP